MLSADRALVRRWRQHVRALVRSNPVLQRQRRAAPSAGRRQWAWSVLRGVVPLGIFSAAATGFPVDRLVSLGVLWTLCVTLVRAAQVAGLRNPEALWICYHWPVDNADVFQHTCRLWLRSSVWLALDWLALGVGFAVRGLGQEWWVLAPLLAWSQGAAALAVALWAVHRGPRLPFGGGATLCWMLLIVCSQLYENAGAQKMFVGPFLETLRWLTPAGWLSLAMTGAAAGAAWGWAVLLLIGLAATLALKPGLAALRAGFRMEEVFGYDEPAGDNLVAPVRTEDEDGGYASVDHASISRSPLMPADSAALRPRLVDTLTEAAGFFVFSRGPFERLLVRLLTLRQRVLLDFFRPAGPVTWGRGWCIALGAVVIARLFHLVGLEVWWGALCAALGVGLFALPLFGGLWRGFEGAPAFGATIGLQSLVPIGFRETAALRLTVNTLRTLAAWPLLWLAIRYGLQKEPVSWLDALDYSLRVSAVVLAVQPVWIVAAFSKTTNDTSARWWVTLLVVGGILLTVLGGFSLGFMTFAVETAWGATASGSALLSLTHAALLAYGWALRRGLFDLVAVPR